MSTLTIKYRLYPTPAQETTLQQTLDTCCAVYNSLVHWRKHDYEVHGVAPSYYDQKKALPVWKETHPELREVYSQVLQDVCRRVDQAFESFFRRIQAGDTPGYPRLKGGGSYESVTYPQEGGFQVGTATLTLSKIGVVKAVVHRALPGKAKTCTVRIQAGKWFASVACDVEPDPLPPSEEGVGIDVGLNHFAVTNDEQYLPHPRFFRKEEKALGKAQRKADRLKHTPSKEHRARRRKAHKVVSRIHERIRNRRHNFVHQLARKLVNRYGLMAVEELCVENMNAKPKAKPDTQNPGRFLPNGANRKAGLNKSIADAAWSMFRAVLTQKAESAGREVIAVNPAYTSQICSECGHRVPKTLSERVHACPCCGLVVDRDVNAARNILKIAVGQHSVLAQTR